MAFSLYKKIVKMTYLRTTILAYFLTETLNWQVLWGKEKYFYRYFYIYIFIKACVRYLLSNFSLAPNDSPSKTMKTVFLFHLKTYFCSGDVKMFVFSSFLLFLNVIHCFSGWSKKNLKVYDVINGLSKDLKTHFVWHVEKEIKCDTQTLSIIRVSNKEHFYGKVIQNVDQKLVLDSFLILIYKLNSHCMQGILWKRIIKKSLKS